MALNKVTINKGSGGLGRPLAGEDHISGLIFYTTALPSGFSNAARIKNVFSTTEAEALGIVDTHIGETRATSTFSVTGIGSTNDTIAITVNSTEIASYTKVSGDTSLGLVAVALTNSI